MIGQLEKQRIQERSELEMKTEECLFGSLFETEGGRTGKCEGREQNMENTST